MGTTTMGTTTVGTTTMGYDDYGYDDCRYDDYGYDDCGYDDGHDEQRVTSSSWSQRQPTDMQTMTNSYTLADMAMG